MMVSGAGALALWGDAEAPRLVQLGEETVSGGPNSNLPVPTERLMRRWNQAPHSVK